MRARFGAFIWLQRREEGKIPRKPRSLSFRSSFPVRNALGKKKEGADARGPVVSERGGGARLSAREEERSARGSARRLVGRASGPGEEEARGAGPRGERGGSAGVFFLSFSFVFSFRNPFPNKNLECI